MIDRNQRQRQATRCPLTLPHDNASLHNVAGVIERDVSVRTPEGVVLSTNVYHPDGDGPFPTLLQRTCYGKEFLAEYAGLQTFLDAGYRVVFQDCRGSGGSSGEQDHFWESADGRVAGDWIAAQPWFDGRLGTFGSSYMGFTQWALAATRPPYLKAMAIGLTGSKGGHGWFPGGSFALDICLPWTMTRVFGFVEAQQPALQAKLLEGFNHLPLRDADRVATGQTVPWYQRWMDHPSADDPFWKPLDFSGAVDIDVPVLFMDGWYDYATVNMVRDFERRQQAGRISRLTIGPGTHFYAGPEQLDETVRWFDRHLKGDRSAGEPAPVSVYVLPDVGWRELPAWPPVYTPDTWWLHPHGGLAQTEPPESPPSTFAYDPADPTPAVGGPSLRMDNCGPADNRDLEARPDVLTFTSEPLTAPIETIGTVNARLYLRSDVDSLDVYLRLCDVTPTGESINICEVIRRINLADTERDAENTVELSLDLWPTAQRFAVGHRIRLQVSGGAHPMFARNTCSGEPLPSATTVAVAHNQVHHEPQRPSALTLRRPVTGPSETGPSTEGERR